jgi:hypothetical protein
MFRTFVRQDPAPKRPSKSFPIDGASFDRFCEWVGLVLANNSWKYVSHHETNFDIVFEPEIPIVGTRAMDRRDVFRN